MIIHFLLYFKKVVVHDRLEILKNNNEKSFHDRKLKSTGLGHNSM
jgi:hypothetical protein